MTIILLSTPTLYDERRVNTSSCGQCTVASDATDLHGHAVSDLAVLAVDEGITDQARLHSLDAHFKVPDALWSIGTALSAAAIVAALERRHRLRFVHQCNGNAEPVPRGSTGIGHWRTIFGFDPAVQEVTTYSPWGGIVETFPLAVLVAADLCETLEIDAVMPRDVPTPAPSPAAPEDEMLGQFIARTKPDANGKTGLAYFISNGMRFRHILNPSEEADELAVGAWFNGGRPVPMWPGCASGNPVADLVVFGNPDNLETFELLDPAYGATYP